jgi:hypothetical protein
MKVIRETAHHFVFVCSEYIFFKDTNAIGQYHQKAIPVFLSLCQDFSELAWSGNRLHGTRHQYRSGGYLYWKLLFRL